MSLVTSLPHIQGLASGLATKRTENTYVLPSKADVKELMGAFVDGLVNAAEDRASEIIDGELIWRVCRVTKRADLREAREEVLERLGGLAVWLVRIMILGCGGLVCLVLGVWRRCWCVRRGRCYC